ncbi:pyruvate kinase [Chloroflexota bacterium]
MPAKMSTSSKRALRRRTKIVATIGPATGTAAMIERIVRAGVNVVRLNLSHGTHAQHLEYIEHIRNVSRRLNQRVAILVDLPGPKYRIGDIEGDGVRLKKGGVLGLTAEKVPGTASLVSVNIPRFVTDAKKGDTVLLDDGALRLKVSRIDSGVVYCKVMVGGRLTSRRGLVVPGMHISGEFLNDSLLGHIDFAVSVEADFVAISFVSSEEDVLVVKNAFKERGAEIPVISKIERGQAVRNFDSILAASDGVMVARGDLGVDIPLNRVPGVQKEIIRLAKRAGKPVITATQMLESMIHSPSPTRAEVADVANAIYDGTDATMLSTETSMGEYPVQAVRMMAGIAEVTEKKIDYKRLLAESSNWLELKTDELIGYSACHIADTLGANAIVALTESGSTALRVAKYRARMPIIALSPREAVCRRLLLSWGVYPQLIPNVTSVEFLFKTGGRLAKEMGVAKPGGVVVITGGIPVGVAGGTNLLKVETIS